MHNAVLVKQQNYADPHLQNIAMTANHNSHVLQYECSPLVTTWDGLCNPANACDCPAGLASVMAAVTLEQSNILRFEWGSGGVIPEVPDAVSRSGLTLLSYLKRAKLDSLNSCTMYCSIYFVALHSLLKSYLPASGLFMS